MNDCPLQDVSVPSGGMRCTQDCKAEPTCASGAELGMYRMLRGEEGAGRMGWWCWWVKGDTLTSGVYESTKYQRTTVGRLEYETEGERREGGYRR